MIVGLILLSQLLLVLLLLIAIRQARTQGKKANLGIFAFKTEVAEQTEQIPHKDEPSA